MGWLLLPLLFVSGTSALVYEVVWSRSLQYLFGVSTFAITTVVAAYMAGLALGSHLLGRVADQSQPGRAVRLYGWLEIGIGVFAALFPWLLPGVQALHDLLAGGLQQARALRVAVEFALSFLLLLVPTTLMGGTLPLVARALAANSGGAGRAFGAAYACNTLGAVAGTLLAGFVLLEALGMRDALRLVALANVALGLVALWLGRRWRAVGEPAPAPRPPRLSGSVLWIAGLGGFMSLAAEILWVRGFASLFLSTTYTFSLVLALFLLGIALGAALGARLVPGRHTIGVLLVVLAAAMLTQIVLYQPTHAAIMDYLQPEKAGRDDGVLHPAFSAEADYAGVVLRSAFWIALVVLPATIASGALLPALVATCTRGLQCTGRDVGAIYVANTVGSISGCVVAGFLLLPLVGALPACRGLAIAAAAGVLLCGWSPMRALAGAGVVVLALLARGPSEQAQAFSPLRVAELSGGSDKLRHLRWEEAINLGLVQRAHGLACDAAVTIDFTSGQRGLWLNGMPNGSTAGDQPTQMQLALLPYLYAPRLERTLHIGLGTGLTAGTWAALPGVGNTTVVELEGALWDLTREFAPWAFELHDNPRVTRVTDDARAWLRLAPPAAFDAIVSEPSQIWSKGMGNLFTREFFAEVNDRLTADGVFVTWIMGYAVPGEVWGVAVQTLLDSFAHVAAFQHPDKVGDVIFLASRQELVLQRERLQAVLASREGPLDALADALQLDEASDLARCFVAGDQTLRAVTRRHLQRFGRDHLRNRDDHPLLEHAYPRSVVGGGENLLLRELLRARCDTMVSGYRFAQPPGLRGALPLATRLLLACRSDADPWPLLDVERQRAFAFLVAARWRDDEGLAAQLWRDGMAPVDAETEAAIVRWARAHNLPIQKAALPASRKRELETILMRDSVSALLRIPPDDLLRSTLAIDWFLDLVAQTPREPAAEAETSAFLHGVRRSFAGCHAGAEHALGKLWQRQGRQQAVDELLQRWRRWPSAHRVLLQSLGLQR